jgi:hypothetical protein
MARKILLVTEIDNAESTLMSALSADRIARIKAVDDEAKSIMERYVAKIVAAIGKIKNVRVLETKGLRDCIEFESKANGKKSNRSYRDSIIIDADGDGRLAALWLEQDAINKEFSAKDKRIRDEAARLRSDLRLVDSCKQGDPLHKRIVAFVERARAYVKN